jgi:hypothetical protein
MTFPSHLLDELARVFAGVALDRLIKEAAADSSEEVPVARPPLSPESSVESAASPLNPMEQSKCK